MTELHQTPKLDFLQVEMKRGESLDLDRWRHCRLKYLNRIMATRSPCGETTTRPEDIDSRVRHNTGRGAGPEIVRVVWFSSTEASGLGAHISGHVGGSS